MKRIFPTAILILFLSFFVSGAAFSQEEGQASKTDTAQQSDAPADDAAATETAKGEVEETVQSATPEQVAPPSGRPTFPSAANEQDDEQFEDVEEPETEAPAGLPTSPRKPTLQQQLPADEEAAEETAGVDEDEQTGEDEEAPKSTRRKVSIDAVVVVNYSFGVGGDAYSVKYHISMGGDVNADVGVIKGNAKVATDISGFLAKSNMFECVLKVSIADVPYEILFKKVSDNEADLTVSFKGQIMEDWESLCTFLDNSGAKFNTRGAPERWIGSALEKAKPSLNKLNAPLDNGKTTTQKFIIQNHVINDELGSAKIEGTGVVTIENRLAPKATPKNPESRLSRLPPTAANVRRAVSH